jgi:DNA-binding CsgD family transcriptional regulator/uncharacterized protein YegP (UPF0339 family)
MRLTIQETDVLRLVALGRSTKEIAEDLGVSPRTIDFHRANIMDKTGLRSIADLTRYALREGVLLEHAPLPGNLHLTGCFEMMPASAGYEWLLRAADGCVLITGCGQEPAEQAESSIESVRRVASIKSCYRYVLGLAYSPQFFLAGVNGQTLAISVRYPSRLAMELGIQQCRECAPIAPIAKRICS